MAQMLLGAGATLDTRRTALTEAADRGSLATMRWLVEWGARPTGWRHARHHPIHTLVNRYRLVGGKTREAFEAEQRANFAGFTLDGLTPGQMAEIAANNERVMADQMRRYIDRETYLAMLEALLEAGADPDAPWDGGATMLMWAGPETVPLLLAYGADPSVRDAHGRTALHRARDPAIVAALAEAGADVNAVATPRRGSAGDGAPTPLQAALAAEGYGLNGPAVVDALLAAGADPLVPDGEGVSTLAYLRSADRFDALVAAGLDPSEEQPGGGSVLHAMAGQMAAPSAGGLDVLDRLLDAGLDINARDDRGRTVLHEAARRDHLAERGVRALLERGADPAIHDKDGRTPADLVPEHPAFDDVRALLSAPPRPD